MSVHISRIWVLGVLLSAPSLALAEDWVVAQVAGPAKFTTDRVHWQDVTPGTTIPNNGWVNTGPRGRLLLVHVKDRITVQPNTMAGVYDMAGSGQTTTIAQEFGRLDLDIEHKSVPHLSVATPYLAAVVKGTQFNVTVGNGSSDVHVVRGKVEVADMAHGQKADIITGETAKVTPAAPQPMTINGDVKVERMSPAENDNPLMKTMQDLGLANPKAFGFSAQSRKKSGGKSNLAPHAAQNAESTSDTDANAPAKVTAQQSSARHKHNNSASSNSGVGGLGSGSSLSNGGAHSSGLGGSGLAKGLSGNKSNSENGNSGNTNSGLGGSALGKSLSGSSSNNTNSNSSSDGGRSQGGNAGGKNKT